MLLCHFPHSFCSAISFFIHIHTHSTIEQRLLIISRIVSSRKISFKTTNYYTRRARVHVCVCVRVRTWVSATHLTKIRITHYAWWLQNLFLNLSDFQFSALHYMNSERHPHVHTNGAIKIPLSRVELERGAQQEHEKQWHVDYLE